MVDTYVSGAYAARHAGSSPVLGTRNEKSLCENKGFFHFLAVYQSILAIRLISAIIEFANASACSFVGASL